MGVVGEFHMRSMQLLHPSGSAKYISIVLTSDVHHVKPRHTWDKHPKINANFACHHILLMFVVFRIISIQNENMPNQAVFLLPI